MPSPLTCLQPLFLLVSTKGFNLLFLPSSLRLSGMYGIGINPRRRLGGLTATVQPEDVHKLSWRKLHRFVWLFSPPAESISVEKNETERDYIAEAEKLRGRARRLYAEARTMELELRNTKSRAAKNQVNAAESLISRIFPENKQPYTSSELARIILDERWSVDQAVSILEALYLRQNRSTAARVPPDRSFTDGTSCTVIYNATELNYTQSCIDCLIEAAAIIDDQISSPNPMPDTAYTGSANSRWSGRGAITLNSRRKELLLSDEKAIEQRLRLSEDGMSSTLSINETLNGSMHTTHGRDDLSSVGGIRDLTTRRINITAFMDRVERVPAWIPPSLLSYVVTAQSPIQKGDIQAIRDRVLPKTSFYCTSSENIPSAALFRGSIRPRGKNNEVHERNLTASTFVEIQQLMETEGISDRVQLFMMPESQRRYDRNIRDRWPKPVLLAFPRVMEPDNLLAAVQERWKGGSKTLSWMKRLSIVATLITCFTYSASCFALNPTFFKSIITEKDMSALAVCFPLMFGVLGVQGIHELAHIIIARRHGIKIGAPLPLPLPGFGISGCITSLRSFPANRAILLDFALSGPVTAFVISICLMVVGAIRTTRAAEAVLLSFPFVTVGSLKSNLVSGCILMCLAPKLILLPISQPVPISPLFLIGFAGAVASALNLLPFFRLDGGRACYAALGPHFVGIASASSLMLLLSLSLNTESGGLSLWWGVFVVLFQRQPEIPVRNEISELDNNRFYAWLASLVASILTLAPFPGSPGIM